MTDVSFSGKTITVAGQQHQLSNPIQDVVEMDGMVVALQEVPAGEVNNRNIVGFASDGQQQWTVEELPSTKEDKPYVKIWTEDGALFADSWVGIRAKINTSSGAVEETTLVK